MQLKRYSYEEYKAHISQEAYYNTHEYNQIYRAHLLINTLLAKYSIEKIITRYTKNVKTQSDRIRELLRVFIEQHDLNKCVEIIEIYRKYNIQISNHDYSIIIESCLKYWFTLFIHYLQKHYTTHTEPFIIDTQHIFYVDNIMQLDIIFTKHYICSIDVISNIVKSQKGTDEFIIYQIDKWLTYNANKILNKEDFEYHAIYSLIYEVMYHCNMYIFNYYVNHSKYEHLINYAIDNRALSIILNQSHLDIKNTLCEKYSIDDVFDLIDEIYNGKYSNIHNFEFVYNLMKTNDVDFVDYQNEHYYKQKVIYFEIYLYQQGYKKMLTDTYSIRLYRKYKKQADFITSYHINQLTQDLPYYDVNLTKIICDYAC